MYRVDFLPSLLAEETHKDTTPERLGASQEYKIGKCPSRPLPFPLPTTPLPKWGIRSKICLREGISSIINRWRWLEEEPFSIITEWDVGRSYLFPLIMESCSRRRQDS